MQKMQKKCNIKITYRKTLYNESNIGSLLSIVKYLQKKKSHQPSNY